MSLTVTIMTAISAGIYASQGGGTTQARHTWPAGPLNLLRAAQLLPEHQRNMDQAYGNIGHAGSWVQIDDQRIDPMDLPETMDEARALLARVASGDYAAWVKALIDDEAASEVAYWAGRSGEAMRDGASATEAHSYRQGQRDRASTDQIEADRTAREAIEEQARAAADAAASAAWRESEARAAEQHAAWRAATDARQAARDIGRAMRRDWRRAGC